MKKGMINTIVTETPVSTTTEKFHVPKPYEDIVREYLIGAKEIGGEAGVKATQKLFDNSIIDDGVIYLNIVNNITMAN